MNAHAKPSYPGKVAIRHAIQAAKANGLDVAGIEVAPDGTIRILEARAMPEKQPDLFERLEAEGRL
jgi:hypothetical protein